MTSNGRIWSFNARNDGTGVLTPRTDLTEELREVAKIEGQIKCEYLSRIGLLLDSFVDGDGFTSLWVKAIDTNVDEDEASDFICSFHRTAEAKSLLKEIRSALPGVMVLPDPNPSNVGRLETGELVVFDPYTVQ